MLLLPLLVYERVAGADGRIDDAEWARFEQDLSSAEEFTEPLMREVFAELRARDLDALVVLLRALEDGLVASARLALERRLAGEGYHRFVAGLLVWGMGLAQASGGFLGRFGSKVSREEMAALTALAEEFELDPSVWMG